jgi:hypothetical protein
MCRENAFVRIVGQLREYEGRKHVLIYDIAPINDWNELTHHLLQIVLVHLQNTKGPIPVRILTCYYQYYCCNRHHDYYHDCYSALFVLLSTEGNVLTKLITHVCVLTVQPHCRSGDASSPSISFRHSQTLLH